MNLAPQGQLFPQNFCFCLSIFFLPDQHGSGSRLDPRKDPLLDLCLRQYFFAIPPPFKHCSLKQYLQPDLQFYTLKNSSAAFLRDSPVVKKAGRTRRPFYSQEIKRFLLDSAFRRRASPYSQRMPLTWKLPIPCPSSRVRSILPAPIRTSRVKAPTCLPISAFSPPLADTSPM